VFVGVRTTRADEAESVSARLSWQRLPGAESCIDGASLEAAINRRWRRQVFVESGAAELVVEGKVGRSADRWSASIEMRRADGTSLGSRELVTKASDCSALDDSVALALGIMLDMTKQRIVEERALKNEAAAAGSNGQPSPVTNGAAAEPPPAKNEHVVDGPTIAIPPETAAPRAPWHVEPSVGVQGALGVLPKFALGGRAGVGLIPPGLFRFELSASFFWQQDAREGLPGARFSAWSAELSAFPFVVTNDDALRFDVGAGVRILELRAEGVGLDQTGIANETVVALGPRAALAWRFAGHFEAILGGAAEVALSRYRFVYQDSLGGPVPVHETSLFSGELYAGLALLL
jgi:hypothetical protein